MGWRAWLPWECQPDYDQGRRGTVDYALFDSHGDVAVLLKMQGEAAVPAGPGEPRHRPGGPLQFLQASRNGRSTMYFPRNGSRRGGRRLTALAARWQIAAALLLVGLAALFAAPDTADAASPSESRKFKTRVSGAFNAMALATGVQVPSSAAFGETIIVAHKCDSSFFSVGGSASAGLKALAETGLHRGLRDRSRRGGRGRRCAGILEDRPAERTHQRQGWPGF